MNAAHWPASKASSLPEVDIMRLDICEKFSTFQLAGQQSQKTASPFVGWKQNLLSFQAQLAVCSNSNQGATAGRQVQRAK